MARAGRRPGQSGTRAQILGSARTLFAEHGYHGTTVRAVAADAGVNLALVHHYFGSKDQLFVAAMDIPINPAEIVEGLLAAGPHDEFPERLVRTFVRTWRDPDMGERLRAMLRSAAASADSGAAVRQLIEQVVLPRVAIALDISELRVAAMMSQLIGYAFAGMVIGAEPLASATEDEMVAVLTPTIEAYLAG